MIGPERENDPERTAKQKEIRANTLFNALEHIGEDDDGNRLMAMPEIHTLTKVVHDIENRVLGYMDTTGTITRADRAENFKWVVKTDENELTHLYFVNSDEPPTIVKGISLARTMSTNPLKADTSSPLLLVPWVLGYEEFIPIDTPSNPFIRILE